MVSSLHCVFLVKDIGHYVVIVFLVKDIGHDVVIVFLVKDIGHDVVTLFLVNSMGHYVVIVFLVTYIVQYIVYWVSGQRKCTPYPVIVSQVFNMQGLLVEALALRQLGRLKPRQLLTPGYGFKQTTWCPRIMYTRQLWGSSVCFTLGSHRPVVRGRDSVRNWSLHQLRFKSNKKKGLAKVLEEEEEERDTEDTDSEDEIEEDPNLPKDYKDLEKFVQSYRYDVILKSGLDMARK